MKFILPLIISIFITGCNFASYIQPSVLVKEKLENTPTEKKKTADFFKVTDTMNKEHVYTNLNDTIINIAEQLFDTKLNKKNSSKVILTTFVDLNDLDKTSTFGRIISESMFNELHIRKFLVTDFRGKEDVSVNENGEFHITRDVEKLKDIVNAVEYILVGTYVKFENQSILVNARILDSVSGSILSSARVVYKPRDCSLFDVCMKKNIIESKKMNTKKPKKMNLQLKDEYKTPIMIIEDK